MKNKFNNIGSKEWLPFQKSWSTYQGDEALYRANIRFFILLGEGAPAPWVFYHGQHHALAAQVAGQEGRRCTTKVLDPIQFGLLDLRGRFDGVQDYILQKAELINIAAEIYKVLDNRRFICIIIDHFLRGGHAPLAWDLAASLSGLYSLKDEKILAYPGPRPSEGPGHAYALYLRKDESSGLGPGMGYPALLKEGPLPSAAASTWQVVRPPRRNPNEVLHPAKFPEQLVAQFIDLYCPPGGAVLDPMCGTGSALVAAQGLHRRAYGCELSPFFAQLAQQRMHSLHLKDNIEWKVANVDARACASQGFPRVDYMVTSPPYWDMLNMKGAEYQARRKEKGLQLNYSDNPNDLGNIADYQQFVDELVEIYCAVGLLVNQGGKATIIVKNIKKKGRNYPLAYDLANRMCQMGWRLLPEFIWCQDDINLAPYGYGNTWVSNTFHQYCLHFEKIGE
jgi:DNA modification methylase